MATSIYKINQSGTPAEPELHYLKLDLGEPLLEKLWRRVYMNIDGYPGGAPTMEYTTYTASTGTVTDTVTGFDLGNGRFMFRFKVGARGRYADLKFAFVGMPRTSVIRPPIEVDISPGRTPK